MNKKSLVIVPALVAFGLVGCAGNNTAPQHDESTMDSEDQWDLQHTDQSISMKASKETQEALGVTRWHVKLNADGAMDYEGKDSTGATLGRAHLGGSRANGKTTLTMAYDGAQGPLSGELVLDERGEFVDIKATGLAPAANWMNAFSLDLEAYENTHPVAYKNAAGCVGSIVGLAVLTLGVFAAGAVCIASVSCAAAVSTLTATSRVIGGTVLSQSLLTVGENVVSGVKDMCGIK